MHYIYKRKKNQNIYIIKLFLKFNFKMSIQIAKRVFNANSLLCRALVDNNKVLSAKYHEKVKQTKKLRLKNYF
jgi:hypothetical protein